MGNWVIVAVVVQDCTWTFVEVRIADNYETVEAMVESNSPPLLLSLSRTFVAAKAANNLAVSAVNVADASTLPVAGETTADNWSAVVAMFGNTGYSAAMVRRTEMVLAASAEEKSEFAGATIAGNSDRVVRSDMNLEVAVTTANSWRDVFAAMTAGRNSAAEETAARTR